MHGDNACTLPFKLVTLNNLHARYYYFFNVRIADVTLPTIEIPICGEKIDHGGNCNPPSWGTTKNKCVNVVVAPKHTNVVPICHLLFKTTIKKEACSSMISFRFVSIVLLAVVAATPTVHGFVSKSATHGTGICSRTATTITKNTQCFVKFDKSIGQFVPESSDEEASAGYDAVGTLLRHGPQPWIQRTFKNGEYEQAVLKFMAMEKVDRNTAQGNMDACKSFVLFFFGLSSFTPSICMMLQCMRYFLLPKIVGRKIE